jgi:murein DD-endopeptidase MepM/ murein hydrolase activator NlpD
LNKLIFVKYSRVVITSPCLIWFIFIVSLLQLSGVQEAVCGSAGTATHASSGLDKGETPSERFDTFNTLVRDGKISRNEGIKSLRALLEELKEDYYRRGGKEFPRDSWIFPVQGYDAKSLSGTSDKGYTASGYDYFGGNRHGGHPSFDIFIRDRNQDGLDDRSGLPVRVLSLGGGMVVAMESQWEQGSALRGGKYIWIYDPGNELLVYYAHNGSLAVGLGDIVRPGDLLGVVGRSGLHAAKRRSPTHLHLTVLALNDGRPSPLNVYQDLAGVGKVLSDGNMEEKHANCK